MFLKTKLLLGKQASNRKAQSSLEMTVAIICILILLLSSIRLFIWVNKLVVLRQEAYEESRVQAANTPPYGPQQVDESGFPSLNMLGN